MLEMLAENRRYGRWSGIVAVGLLALTGCCTLNAAPRDRGPDKPTPEVFDQEVVKIWVDYRGESIMVEPEKAKIYFQWNREEKDPLKPVQVRWLVKGLSKDHVVHIVPKEKAPDGVFPIPEEFEGRPAYSIQGEFNSIVSGEVLRLPYLVKDKGYVNLKRGEAFGEDNPYKVVWYYDVIVADRRGRVLFRVDPQVVIHGHP